MLERIWTKIKCLICGSSKMIKKTQLTKELEEWLNDFAMKKYSEEYDVKIIIPKNEYLVNDCGLIAKI